MLFPSLFVEAVVEVFIHIVSITFPGFTNYHTFIISLFKIFFNIEVIDFWNSERVRSIFVGWSSKSRFSFTILLLLYKWLRFLNLWGIYFFFYFFLFFLWLGIYFSFINYVVWILSLFLVLFCRKLLVWNDFFLRFVEEISKVTKTIVTISVPKHTFV